MFKTSQFPVNSIGKKMNSCAIKEAKFSKKQPIATAKVPTKQGSGSVSSLWLADLRF